VSALVALVIGIIISFLVTKRLFEKQIRENPLVNEQMIRTLYSQVGKKPKETEVKKIMNMMLRQQQLPKNKIPPKK
jgi:hypothetical protein